MADRELLEATAKAAGIDCHIDMLDGCPKLVADGRIWNPLADAGDAMRLAAAQLVDVEFTPVAAGAGDFCYVEPYADHGGDRIKAACRAIVRCVVARGEQAHG